MFNLNPFIIMAKGNMFISTSKGKIGNLVLFTRAGSQITRAYQSEVKNPKTTKQMLQRAKFANAVKFYQQAVQNFFKFAYEDKKSNETDYNAFMRHNISVSCHLKKAEVDSPYFPALGRWVFSAGSLSQAFIPVFEDGVAKLANAGVTADMSTVSKVSELLISQGFNAGDIVTIVAISSLVNSIDFDLTTYENSGNLTLPAWDIRQFIVNAADETEIADVPGLGAKQGALGVAAGGLTYAFTHNDFCNGVACIVTRKSSSGTKASNSELVPNAVALAMINASTADAWLSAVATSWSASGDAILQGSVAEGSGTQAEAGAGTGTSTGGSTGGTTAESKITSVNGGSYPITQNNTGELAVTVVGTSLSSVAPTSTSSAAKISNFTVNTAKTQATFTLTTESSAGTYSVAYMGETIISGEIVDVI